jgi:hypothetical protein
MVKETDSRKSQLVHRASPPISATKYSEGSKKKGNDGNTWIVSVASNGVKRWKLVSPSTKKEKPKQTYDMKMDVKVDKKFDELVKKSLAKHTKVITKNITFDFVRSVKHVGTLMINKKVLIGDVDWDALNLRSGKYNVYIVDESPMIVHESLPKITKQNLSDYHFNDYGYSVGVDNGVFGFFDSQYVQSTVLSENRKYSGKGLPMINWMFNNKVLMKQQYFFIKPKYLKSSMDINYSQEEKVGFVSSTGQGDGSFACLVHKREMAILCGYVIANKLFDRGLIE